MTNAEKSQLQKEVLDFLPPQPSGRLLLAPRIGKTKIGIDLIKREEPNSILWVTPSAELATVDIPGEFEKWGAKKYLNKLTTVTWKSLDTIKGTYNMIILDEDQHATPNNVVNLFNKSLIGHTIISMTGTASKDRLKNQIFTLLKLEVIYELSLGQAVDLGLLANYKINVITTRMSTTRNLTAGTKEKPFLTSEVSNYEYLTKAVDKATGKNKQFKILNRMRAIKNSPAKLAVAQQLLGILGGRRLIFSATIEQSKKLSQFTYNSKTDNKDLILFKEGKINSLALVNSGGTGFTYKAIDHLVVVQGDSDNNGLTSQKIARTLLDQPDYKATIWMICLLGTQDVKWIESTLQRFDKSKIEFLDFDQFKKTWNGNKS
jgi:hypothetical protein